MAGGLSARRWPRALLVAKSITIQLLIWLAACGVSAANGTSTELARTKRPAPTRAMPSGQLAKGPPEFAGPIGNVSAVLGRDVRLVCTVDNLGQHQVSSDRVCLQDKGASIKCAAHLRLVLAGAEGQFARD